MLKAGFIEGIAPANKPWSVLAVQDGIAGELGRVVNRWSNEFGEYLDVEFPLYGAVMGVPVALMTEPVWEDDPVI